MSQAIGRAADAECPAIEDVQVDHRRGYVAVAEQLLNRADVVSGLQQVRRKRVPERILTLPMNRPPPSFTTVTIRFTANP